jgi:hypothetical protein
MPFEKSFEIGRISVMKGSRRVLVKVVLVDGFCNFIQRTLKA